MKYPVNNNKDTVMQDLVLEIQEVLAEAVRRGDSAACDDAKVALQKLKTLAEQVQELEDSLAIAQATMMNGGVA